MKEYLNDKEEKIVDLMGDIHIDINTDSLWAELEPQLDNDDSNKKGAWWYWWAGTAVALMVMGVFFYTAMSTGNDSLVSDSATQEEMNTVAVSESKDDQIVAVETIKKQNDSRINEQKVELGEQDLTTVKTASNSTEYKQKDTVSKAAASTISSNYITNTENTTISIYNQDQENTTVTTVATATESESDNTTIDAIAETNEVAHSNNVLLTVDQIARVNTLLDYERIWADRKTDMDIITPAYIATRQLILGAQFGLNQNQTTVTSLKNEPGILEEYDYEKDRLGLSAGIFVGVENQKGWRFKAGMAYHRYATSYQREGITLFRDEVSGIEYYRINEDGQQTPVNGTTQVLTVKDIDLDWTRTHDAIDLYATVGKRIFSLGGFMLAVDLGAGVNNYTNHNGYYIANSDFGFTKIENDTHPYKVSSGWYALGQLELAYGWDQWRVGLNPFIRRSMNAITEKTNYSQIKNSQIGIQLSMTYLPRWE